MRGKVTAPPATISPADALLANGAVITIRPVTVDDADALTALYERASQESMRRRFFSYAPRVGAEDIRHMMRPPTRDHLALAAVDASGVLGVASLARSNDDRHADFALLVDDARHGEGIGTLLIEHIVAAARQLGYRAIHADVLAENTEMLHVLRDLGVEREIRNFSGVVEIDFAVPDRDTWRIAVQDRDSVADHASLRRLLAPSVIAVVGAGRRPEGVGHRIVANLLAGGYTGTVLVVNPGGYDVCGLPGHHSLLELPELPDLVIIAVPARQVGTVVAEAVSAGAYGAVIVSDGFAELGDAGREMQREIVAIARQGGMRLIGPNCLGVLNADPNVRMNATFADVTFSGGSVGVASQSGGVGLALIDALGRRGIGVSTFVSMGNKADVSGNDLLQYWSRDPSTSVCLLYLESFGNARKFARIARQVSMTKPVVAITAGRSVAGARGVRSHTAAAATPDVALDALFRQAGVIRASTLSEAMEIVALLDAAPLPAGRRVGIVSNGGGPAALTADACSAAGLELPELGTRLRRRLATVLPPHAATSNPVDTTAGGGPAALAESARLIAESGELDSVIVIHTSLARHDRDAVAEVLAPLANCAVPVLAVLLGDDGVPEALRRVGGGARIACFAFPETAASALAAVSAYAAIRRAPHPTPSAPRRTPRHARDIVERFLADNPDGGWLDTSVAAELLRACRVPVATTLGAHTPAEAVAAASQLTYPVVVKASAGTILHRTDEGGVFLGVRSARAVGDAVRAIQTRWGKDCPVVVQPMLPPGVETAVGVIQDPTVGPVVMLALGGIATDLLADRSFRLPPFTRADARAQIHALRGAPLLSGYRGTAPCDIRALENVLLRVGDLALALPEVAELDLNPVVVTPDGAVAVDVKIRLAPTAQADPYLRRLPSAR